MHTKTKWKFEIIWADVNTLNPALYNPRKDLTPEDLEYKKIQKSLNEFGLVDPLIINQDMTVIGGHQRLKVLKDAGFEKVPCSIVDLDKKKEKALNIALNKITGEWDFPKLSDLLVELDDGAFDMEAIGFSNEELMGILAGDNDILDGDMGSNSDGNPIAKLIIPSGVWFDSSESITNKINEICERFGIEVEWPT